MKVLAILAFGLALLSPIAQLSRAAKVPAVRATLKHKNERQPAPSFHLRDTSGNSVKVSGYRGKVLLLNFWATWCGGCKTEMPWFQEFETRLGPRRFAVLGVSLDEEGWAAVKPYIQKSGVTYRMVLFDQPTLDRYTVTSLPATFIIDRHGRIAATYTGLVDKADLETNLRSVLRER